LFSSIIIQFFSERPGATEFELITENSTKFQNTAKNINLDRNDKAKIVLVTRPYLNLIFASNLEAFNPTHINCITRKKNIYWNKFIELYRIDDKDVKLT